VTTHAAPDEPRFETCRIRRWRGYTSSTFYACAETGEVLAESSPFRWRKDAPPPETAAARAAYDDVVARLIRAGWSLASSESAEWFATVFTRPRASGLAEAAPPAETVLRLAAAEPVEDLFRVDGNGLEPEGDEVPAAEPPVAVPAARGPLLPVVRPPAPAVRDLRRERPSALAAAAVALAAWAAMIVTARRSRNGRRPRPY
jgi:hypothetical protein